MPTFMISSIKQIALFSLLSILKMLSMNGNNDIQTYMVMKGLITYASAEVSYVE